MATAPEPADDHDEPEVVASLDGEGESREFVLADITTDEAWVTILADDAAVLSAWR